MLIAEDLLLLLLDDESGAVRSNYMQPALGGALLVELAVSECVGVGRKRWWRAARVTVTPGAPTPEDPLLVDALQTVAKRPRTAQDLVERLGRNQLRTLTGRLVERGILEQRDSRVLGIFPRHRWPSLDATHEDEVRRRLSASLVGGLDPDPRTGALIALLLAVDRVHKTIAHDGLSNRDIKRRAKEIADGNWAAKGVKDAIQAAQAAVAAGVAVSTSAAAVST